MFMKNSISISRLGSLSAIFSVLIFVSCLRTSVMTTGISLDSPSLILTIGESKQIKVEVLPSNASDKNVIWISTNPEVASVSATGLITAISPGSAAIVASATCGGFTATCRVSVVDPVSGISLDKKSVTLYENEFVDLKATLATRDASNDKVIWRSTADSLVTVHEGRVTARRAPADGKAVKIIALTGDESFNDVCDVTVKCHVSSVSFCQNSITLVPGECFDLEPEILPLRATDKSYRIESSDPSAVTVSQEGVVCAVAETEQPVEITLTSNDEIAENLFRKATCKVVVSHSVRSPAGIKILKNGEETDSFDLMKGDERDAGVTLEAGITPDDADNKKVTWTSTNPDVVGLSSGTESSVYVKALKNGSAEIIASTEDKGLIATCKVNVYTPLRSIEVSPVEDLWQGDVRELQLVLDPADASVSPVEWSVSDPSLAKISGNSLLAVKAGPGDVTVTAKVGCIYSPSDVREKSVKFRIKCHVSGIRLNRHTLALEAGTSDNTLSAVVLPDNATDKSYTWSSDAPDIIAVDPASGRIEARKVSDSPVFVRVKSTDGSLEDKCEVSVFKNLTGLAVYCNGSKVESTLSLNPGDKRTLEARLEPKDASKTVIRWKTGDEKIAKIDDVGNLTAVANGVTSVFAIADNGLSAQCEVKVTTAVTSISFDSSSLVSELYQGDKPVKFVVKFNPETASDKSLAWKSSNENVLYVASDGSVMPRTADPAVGKVTVTATTPNGKSCSQSIAVKCHVSDISLSESKCTLKAGQTVDLVAKIFPSNATDQGVIWKTSNQGVATVTNGIVTAKSVGEAVITATSEENQGISASCTITVSSDGPVRVSGVTLSETSLSLNVGESRTLTAGILPSNAADKSVTWKTSNPGVATVINGTVSAKSVGTATITVETNDGGFTRTCAVTVNAVQISSMTIEPSAVNIETKSTKQLSVNVYPSAASKSGLVWQSSNTNVATVSTSGLVTGKSAGTADITVVAPNGVKSSACRVNVVSSIIHVKRVILSAKRIDLYPGQDTVLTVRVDPEDATNKEVIWEVNGGGIIVSEGRVTATKAGSTSTYVTVTSVDNPECKNTCIFNTIEVKAKGMSLSRSALTMKSGDTAVLEPVFNPVHTTYKDVTWQSDNASVVTVESGKLKAVGIGKATVTATSDALSESGQKLKATCLVVVTDGTVDDNTSENVGFDDLN